MILLLDYDGVLHPNEAYITKTGVVLRCDGHNLFEHAEMLADLIAPYPHVKIVLSTSWVPALTFAKAKARLPTRLQEKVKGATWQTSMRVRELWDTYTRYQQILFWVRRHGVTEWVAVDDDNAGWPEDKRHHLVHTNEWGGIGDKAAQDELIAKLEAGKK